MHIARLQREAGAKGSGAEPGRKALERFKVSTVQSRTRLYRTRAHLSTSMRHEDTSMRASRALLTHAMEERCHSPGGKPNKDRPKYVESQQESPRSRTFRYPTAPKVR